MYSKDLYLIVMIIICSACKQSDPPTPKIVQEPGDIRFSGFEWNYKTSNQPVGPGPNYFAATEDNIWLDAEGMLHMKITNKNNQWQCPELISTAELGYGTYIWTVAGDLTTMNEKAVLGLFTWNSYSFQTQGNSEVDIEFSRWDNPNDSTLLTYSNQPVWFSVTGPYQERSIKPTMQVSTLQETTTHAFRWTPEKIEWRSYKGDQYPGTELIASWDFDLDNPARRKYEGSGISDEIIIPEPEDSTNARMNLWLLNGQAPADNSETEVIIKSFNFIPL